MFEVSFIDFDTKLIRLNIDLEIIIFDFDDVIIMESTVLKDRMVKKYLMEIFFMVKMMKEISGILSNMTRIMQFGLEDVCIILHH